MRKYLPLLLLLLATPVYGEIGTASWYGSGNPKERLNEFTASGERFNPEDFTAATYNYPFGTKLRVTNLSTGKSVVVKVNDRGPNRRLNRVIDLSRAAFAKISMLKHGLIIVKVERI